MMAVWRKTNLETPEWAGIQPGIQRIQLEGGEARGRMPVGWGNDDVPVVTLRRPGDPSFRTNKA